MSSKSNQRNTRNRHPKSTPPVGKQQKKDNPVINKTTVKEEVEFEPWTPATYTAFKALLSARLCAAIWSNISDCDETYNYWEPTHFLLYGSGFQTWEYSPVYAIRSYAYIILHATPTWLYGRLLQANKGLVFYFLRCLLAFACALSEVYFYKAVRNGLGAGVARTMLVFLIFSAGMFTACSAYLPSSFAMYMTMLSLGAWLGRNYPAAILGVAAAAFVGWPFAAVLGVPLAWDVLFVQKKVGVFIKWCILAVILILLPLVTVDSSFYGKLVIAPLNIVLYNVFSTHGPNIYGTEPWTYYFINGFLNFNFVFAAAFVSLPLLFVLALTKASKKPNTKAAVMYMLPLYIWIAIFFTRPHKEERFLFPIYPLICLGSALTLDYVQNFLSLIRGSQFLRSILNPHWIVVSFLVVSSSISVSRILALYQGYHAPLEIYMALGQLESENPHKTPINVCVGKEWYRFPSSFFLPHDWILQFIESEFRGQLPQPFSSGPRPFSGIPPNMNDENLEEVSRYVDIKLCHYLVDLDSPTEAPREPRYSLQKNNWTVLMRVPFLETQNSHRLLRAFYVPFVTEVHCKYSNYVLLKNNHLNHR